MNSQKHTQNTSEQIADETDFAKDPLSDKIGDSLKEIYQDVINEPIPDEFLEILKRSDNKKS